jgi:hypothetical protein
LAAHERDNEDDYKMKTVALPDGERVPVLGQGTWRMGEKKRAHADEVAALRLGGPTFLYAFPSIGLKLSAKVMIRMTGKDE